MKMKLLATFLMIIFLVACKKNTTEPVNTTPPINSNDPLYFPPTTGIDWQNTTPASLGWNETELNNLYAYLGTKNSKAFIILKNGKIVVERYFGTFTRDSSWYWASAGKTMTAYLVGIAQQEGLLNINNRSNQYLGAGFSSAPLAKEKLNNSSSSTHHDIRIR